MPRQREQLPVRIPNAATAYVEDIKLVGYLLNRSHMRPSARAKAEFFLSHGYIPDAFDRLAKDLLKHVRTHPVTSIDWDGANGPLYSVLAPMALPDGEVRVIRSVWEVPHEGAPPHLVTAYRDSTGDGE